MSIGGTKTCRRTMFLLASLCLLSYHFVFAGDAPLLINEIAWMGDSENYTNEWVELYNGANEPLNLTNWRIENGLAKNEALLIEGGLVPANGFFVICKKPLSFCDVVAPKMSLHNEYNSNGNLVLKNANGIIIHQTPTAESKLWPAGDNKTKQTMHLCHNEWQASPLANGSPKQPNSCGETSAPAPSQNEVVAPSQDEAIAPSNNIQSEKNANTPPVKTYPANILINEIMPSPEGPDAENEWIEIYNNNNFAVDLIGWQIRDTIGSVKKYTFPKTNIPAFGYFVLWRPQSKITLQNSGDGLVLTNPSGKIISQVDFGKADIDESYCRFADSWQWCLMPSPGKQNIANPTTKTPTTNTANATTSKNALLADIIGQKTTNQSQKIIYFSLAFIVAGASAFFVFFLRSKTKND